MPDRESASTASDSLATLWARLDELERAWNAALNRAMGGSLFGAFLQGVETIGLGALDATQALRRSLWHAFDLPTRGDVVGLAEHLGEIEDQLHRLEHALDELRQQRGGGTARGPSAAPSPPRTRRPPRRG